MDEDSRLSTSTSQPQPSTSDPSSSFSESSNAVTSNPVVKTSEEIQKQETTATTTQQPQQQPSTSKTCKDEKRDFGYSDTLPFAPWRRKRYGLTVQGLHEEIVDMYHWIKPNEIESRLRTKVYEKVRLSVLRKWAHKNVKISMFGSLRTNLFLPTSDIDVLVECDDWVGSNPNDGVSEDWLSETARGLEDDRIAESVSIYGGAFVPIVKMVDRDTRLSIDISFNTVQGVRAASYIAKVKQEFPLIEPLVLLLKQFLHYRNLNQTFTGGLSSYGLVLLLVNFFQLYAVNMRHRTIFDRDVNLGHLLLRFLEIYSQEFNFEEIGISPGQACYIPKAAAGARYGHKRAQPGNLALEDPLLTANDVGRSTYNFSSIANAFGQALQILMVAVTLRERKGKGQLAKVYKGSLLHLIMPFTSKELTYRNWLMSGVLSFPRKDGTASYDLNQLHNTLVSPTVDLSRYGWLRKIPPAPVRIIIPLDSSDSSDRPMKVPDAAEAIKQQVLAQLKAKIAEEKLAASASASASPSESTMLPVTSSNPSDLTMTAPPIPTNTASVNTSATVSTAASISERDDTDSPGLSSSTGAPSSEDDDDGMMHQNPQGNHRKTSATAPVQFKKPFSEVVAQSSSGQKSKECSKRTQTNFDPEESLYHPQFIPFHAIPPSYQIRQPYLDYASAAAGFSSVIQQHHQNVQKHHLQQRPNGYRNHRNHSQGSDGSEGYQRNRWNDRNQPQPFAMLMGPHQAPRGRRAPRTTSNSSNRSRHSSNGSNHSRTGRGGAKTGRSGMPLSTWPAVAATSSTSGAPDADATITEESGEKNSTLTSDACRGDESTGVSRMYADAVKKKSSVGTNSGASGAVEAAKSAAPAPAPAQRTPQPDRSYCTAIKANLYPKPVANVSSSSTVPEAASSRPSRKENECGLDTKSLDGTIRHPVEGGLHHSNHLAHGIFSN